MDHHDRIDQALDFMESHLTSSITIHDIARCACFSPFHFQRVFQTLTGYSVMEYLRRRRLHEAAHELLSGNQRILEIALDYQYETHESFSRAFKKHYGLTPSQFRADAAEATPFNRLDLMTIQLQHMKGGMNMRAKIIKKNRFMVIGVSLRTTTCDSANLQAIPAFWGRFVEENREQEIPNRISANTMLGMCADSAADGSFTYLICAEVSSIDKIPDGMVAHTIPAARYAVFTSKGKIPESIHEAWRYILTSGLTKAGYEHAGTEDFELYDERMHNPGAAEFDIFIPIK